MSDDICGLPRQIFYVLAIGPLLVTVIIGAACSHHIGTAIVTFVNAHWSKIREPLQKLIVDNTDKFIAILGTVMVLPCILSALVVGARLTLLPVYYSAWMVPMWAQVVFWASVTGLLSGVGTLLWQNYTVLVNSVGSRWQNVKTQTGVEDYLADKENAKFLGDFLTAGIAITALLPIAAAIVYSVLRGVYNFGKLKAN